MDAEQAAKALADANLEDAQEGGYLSSAQQAELDARQFTGEQAEAPVEEGSGEQPEAPDSFSRIDPNTLPPELLAQYKSMQADYTRTKQSLAEERRQYEALNDFGGVEAAVEAVQFANALATDPQFALSVHENLTKALTDAGMPPVQAAQEASRQINEAAAEADDFDDFSEQRVDPAVEKKLSELDAKLAELDQWRVSNEEYGRQMALANDIAFQENKIIQDNPDYAESDLDAIYRIAWSTGGNLIEADAFYKEMQRDLLGRYIEAKGSVSSVNEPAATGSAQIPEGGFKNLNDPLLEKIVQQRLARELAQS